MRSDIRALLKKLGEFEAHVGNGFEQFAAQLAEFGSQLFGMHIVQEMLCEKLGITEDEVKARVEAHKARMLEQSESLRAAAEKAHAEALAEKERQRAEKEAAREADTPVVDLTAETTELPALMPVEGNGEATAGGADQPDLGG